MTPHGAGFAYLTAKPRAAYVHIPFCISKCNYCDFNSFAGLESLFGDYVRAAVREIERAPVEFGGGESPPLETVFFGGGTPSVLPTALLGEILRAMGTRLGTAVDSEITLEANPGTASEAKFVELLTTGFNRLSLGVQSFDDALLTRLGRAHTADQAIEAYRAARRAGFTNVGIDLMFALPGQGVESWREALLKAIELTPEHVALYELSIEEGTRFGEMCAKGLLELPMEDARLEMYELAISILTSAGYEHYEVSNFARPGFRCRHNQVYWRNEPYYGFGAGATSYVNGARARRVGDPREYMAAVDAGGDAIEFSEQLTGRRLLAEGVILSLRMLAGLDMHRFCTETGTDVLSEFAAEIERLKSRGLVEITEGHLRVTHEGLLLLNDVAVELLPGQP